MDMTIIGKLSVCYCHSGEAVLEQWRLKDLTWTCLPTETADKHFPETEKDRDNYGEGGGA